MRKSVYKIVPLMSIMILLPVLLYSQTEAYKALLKADAYIKSDDNVSSLSVIDNFLNDGRDYRFLVMRGNINLAEANLSAAESDFSEASKLSAGSGAIGLARVFAIRKDAAGSIAFLNENLNSPFRVSEREIMADKYFQQIENTQEWKRFWNIERYTEAERLSYEVEYLTGIGKLDEAESLIAALGNNTAKSGEVIYSEALLSFQKENYQNAISLLKEIGSVNSSDLKAGKLLAESYLGSEAFEQALRVTSSLIDAEMPDAEIFIIRAKCYHGLSDSKRSLEDIDFYLTLYPSDYYALSLGGLISAQSGDNNSALKYFNRMIDVNPNSVEAYTSRGDIWISTRMWSYANSDFSMALDLDPYNSEVWLSKGISLLNMGKKEEACHDFRQSLKLGNRKASDYVSKNCIR